MFCCKLFSFLGGSVGNYLFTLICAKMVCSYNLAINFDYNMELWVIFVVGTSDAGNLKFMTMATVENA